MKISQVGIDLIKSFEGCRLTAYQDSVGVWTIGYGHTSGVKKGQTITNKQAEEYLKSDLAVFERGVTSRVKVDINQNQFDALVSFSYNVGLGNLSKSDLLKKLNRGDYKGASAEFPLWKYAGGRVLNGLIKRRTAERALFDKKIREDIEMVDKFDININGKDYQMSRILKDGENYVKLRDFEKAGFVISYDCRNKKVSIKK